MDDLKREGEIRSLPGFLRIGMGMIRYEHIHVGSDVLERVVGIVPAVCSVLHQIAIIQKTSAGMKCMKTRLTLVPWIAQR